MTITQTTTAMWTATVDDAVAALASATDGRIAVAGAEGSITFVARDGRIERARRLSLGCLAVSWSPAGDQVAVGCIDGLVILDAAGELVARHPGGWCAALAWSFDGARLAAAIGKSAIVYKRDGTEMFRAERDSTVTDVAWVSKKIASAAYGGVHISHASRGAAPDVLPFTGSLLRMSISPDRRWAASGNQDATLHVWRVGKAHDELAMSGYPTKITALAFSPDSLLLASGGGSDVTVWDFSGPGPRGSTPRILSASAGAVAALDWSPDGTLLTAAADDGGISIWQPRLAVPAKPEEPLARMSRDAVATAVRFCGRRNMLAGWTDGTVTSFRVASSPYPTTH